MSDDTPNAGESEAAPILLPPPQTMSAKPATAPPPAHEAPGGTGQKSTSSPTTPMSAPPPITETKVAPPPARAPRRVWPYWLAAGFIILAGGEAYLFVQQQAHQADKTQLAVLQVEVDDLRADAAKTSPVANLIAAQAQLEQKQTMLAAQINALQNQVTADHGALAALQINAQEISKLTARMARLNVVAAARMALDAGEPLGAIPNAPAALAVFADTAPPTLSQLKEAFPAMARHAEAASLTDGQPSGFWDKVKLRLAGLITISNGEHVIFGPPAAAALNHMRIALANNDLASAVADASGLSAPTQAAMASWLVPARQLLAAQQALLSMTKPGA